MLECREVEVNIREIVENPKHSLSPKDYVSKFQIAFDFDGTITKKSAYPEVGEIDPVMIALIKEVQSRRHKALLWTCREGDTLKEAIVALQEHGVTMNGVNENTYVSFNKGRKMYAKYLFDDTALGYGYAKGLLDSLCKTSGTKKELSYL